jgi:RNA polymerase sigma-70 factor (ECF subfamily)
VVTERADDAVLVDLARTGDRDAAAALFERHWTRAWRTAFAITGSEAAADDVAQEAFEHAFAGLSSFNGRSAFGTWLYRIVVNAALTAVRDERRRTAFAPGPAEPAGSWVASDAELVAALGALAADRRAVVVLRYWLGFVPTEIAELLELPVGTVHSRLARALAELRLNLEGTDG